MNETYVTFQGWVGSDVDLRQVPSGDKVATFRVGSTPRRFRRGEWEDATTIWYTVKAWRGLAEHVAASVTARQPVLVHGRLEADTWQREDGTTAVRYVVVASAVGHDLSRGTAVFTRATPAAVTDPEAWTSGEGDRESAA